MTWQAVLDFFGAARYAEHSICLTNDPIIMLLYVAGDLTTAISYFVIGATLYFYRASQVQLSMQTRVLYGAFIFLCGASHLTEVFTLFSGVYRLDVMITGAMAAVSAATASVTFNDVSGAKAVEP